MWFSFALDVLDICSINTNFEVAEEFASVFSMQGTITSAAFSEKNTTFSVQCEMGYYDHWREKRVWG